VFTFDVLSCLELTCSCLFLFCFVLLCSCLALSVLAGIVLPYVVFSYLDLSGLIFVHTCQGGDAFGLWLTHLVREGCSLAVLCYVVSFSFVLFCFVLF
jgi:hypothetical protein